MIPVPESRLEEIMLPIVEQRIIESSMQGQADARYALDRFALAYGARTAAAFVDSLETPKCLLAMTQTQRMVHPAPICVVLLLWVRPEHRGTAESVRLVAEMFKTLEAYANMNRCAYVTGSSWVYLGSEEIDALWNHHGFDLQEKIFIKQVE